MERRRKPPGAVVSPEHRDSLTAQQERAWQTVERVQGRNAAISPEEVLADVTSEVEGVRQERYEQSEAADTSSR